ncbi:uronyl 2-sulfotransferase-like isoform X2 [Macrobrachium rosenbergii]
MVLKLKWRKFPALLFTVLVSCTLIHTAGRIWHPSAYLWTSFQPYLVQVTSTADQAHNKLKDSSSDVEYDYSDGSSNKEVIPRAKKYSMYWPSQRNSHHWSRRFVDDSPIVYVPTERPFQPSTTEESSLYAPLEKFKSFLALPKSFGSLFDSSVNKEQTPSPFPEFLKVNYSKEELKAFPPVSISIQVSGDDEDYTFSSVNEEVDTVDIKPTAKNVTPSNARLLIYNRVPKCGSTTFNSILDRLCKMNFLRCEHSTVYDKHWIDTASRRKLLHRAMYGHKMIRSKIFERHIYFFNVTRLLKKQKFPPPWWFDMTLDDCIEVGRPECHPSSPQMNMQLTFFCGHHPECRKVGSRWALYRAKRHAEQYYSVVGILEEFTLSLSVLEGYLPRYFGNVHNIRLSSGEVKLNTNNSPSSRKRVSPATLETLQSLLKEDLEFYEFLRQRLHLQAMALGILTT